MQFHVLREFGFGWSLDHVNEGIEYNKSENDISKHNILMCCEQPHPVLIVDTADCDPRNPSENGTERL